MTADVPTPDAVGFENDGDTPKERTENAVDALRENVDGLDRQTAEAFVARYVRGSGATATERVLDAADLSPTFNPADFMGGGGSPYAADPDGTREHLSKASSGPEPDADSGVSLPTGSIPLAHLNALSIHEQATRARQRGEDWPTTDEARERLFDALAAVMRHEDDRVVDAPTSLGKTHTVAATRWGAREDLTGGRPVVHLLETRDARDEAVQIAKRHGGDHLVLRSRYEACDVAAGDHDDDLTIDGAPASEWLETVCEGRGVPFSVAHRYLEDHNDQDAGLPCADSGRYGDECDAIAQWAALRDEPERHRCDVHEHTVDDCHECYTERTRCPEAGTHGHRIDDCPECSEQTVRCDLHDRGHRIDDCPECHTEPGGWAVPLVIATHNFAYAPGLRLENNVVIDEQPDYRQELSTDRVRRAVRAYLREIDAPVTTWAAFIRLATYDPENFDDVAAEVVQTRDRLKDALDRKPDREWYFENPDAHTLAPGLAEAILRSSPRANGRRSGWAYHEPPRLEAKAHDELDTWNRERVSIVIDDDEDADVHTVRSVPDFGAARSVVGLDAHPALPVWQANTVPWIEKRSVLDGEERTLWRRYERGLRVVQVGDATRPFASGEYFDYLPTKAVVEQLATEYGREFRTAITAKSVEDQQRRILRECGVRDPETMHYGEEKSRNDFAGESVGLVNGCIDPGDDFVLDLLAELDLDAEPERSEDADCRECDGAGCFECHGTGMERAHGRGFVGEDAESAQAILASVRENHTAQAAGRYARQPDDPESTATVFVRTDAMPPGFADVQVPGVAWTPNAQQEQTVEVLRESTEPLTARELAADVDLSKRSVLRLLKRLAEHGVVDAIEGAGAHGATLYSDSGLPHAGIADLGDSGEVDLDETTTGPVWGSYTWTVAVSEPDPGDVDPDPADPPVGTRETGLGRWMDAPHGTG